MADFREFFKGKKVTVVGLGLLGKRLGDITFLSECGAEVLVTDLKTEKELAPSIEKLKRYKSIKYALGGHRMEDFENKDFILKGQGTPMDSPYILHAKEKGIPIEMDESLFVKLAPKVKVIGVTGTRGKSTTTLLIYDILKGSGMRVHLGGNLKGMAALPLLKEIKEGDAVVFELSSWQLQGFGEDKVSPYISVFTNFMPDHMNYYKNDMEAYFKDKSYIYKFQNKNDVLVLGPQMKDMVKVAPGKIIHADVSNVPKWAIKLKGEHNLENIACAIEVARALNIKNEVIKDAVEKFEAPAGRLELVKEINGVKIYNDTNSCTPEATTVALRALGNSVKKNIVLIMGGSDKNLSFADLYKYILRYVKEVVVIPGNGTDRILPDLKRLKVSLHTEPDLQAVVTKAYSLTKAGDIILLSPAFTSFGMFANEYERGDKFMEIIKSLK